MGPRKEIEIYFKNLKLLEALIFLFKLLAYTLVIVFLTYKLLEWHDDRMKCIDLPETFNSQVSRIDKLVIVTNVDTSNVPICSK